ncbi:MAG: hypothetical protein K8F91_13430 [Candidatus Obscuribacterales bacterium]|nr:hypothetical protein [Candidatus Obscuribacterales bacterium]
MTENLPEKSTAPAKKESTALGIAKVLGLVCVSPLLIVFGFLTVVSVFGIVFGTMHEVAPWIIVALLIFSLVPAVRDRISGKYDVADLTAQLALLQAELSETKMHLLEIEEATRFDKNLQSSKLDLKESETEASS